MSLGIHLAEPNRIKAFPPITATSWYTANEVSEHNSHDDCWLSWQGLVYDVTKLTLNKQDDPLIQPILKNAGRDISHWFADDGSLRTQISPLTNTVIPFTPEGRFLHVPPPLPRHNEYTGLPWWQDKDNYCIGRLSYKPRKIRIMNTLTKDVHVLECCAEDKVGIIQERFMKVNAHAKGYVWKRLGQILDSTLTLEDNGVKDENNLFEVLQMDDEEWLPTIHLYFSDDLTVA